MPDSSSVAPSIDPGYGNYANTYRLLAAAGNDADGTNSWLNAARQKQALQQGQVNLSKDQLDLGTKQLSALNDIVSSVMADPTPENAYARISAGVRANVIRPEDADREMQTIISFNGDPAKIKQFAFQHGQQIATLQQRMQAAGMDAPQYVSNGQQMVPVVARSGLNPGINPTGGPLVQQYQTPADLAQPRDYKLPNGQNVQTTQLGRQRAMGDTTGIQPSGAALGPYMAPPQPGQPTPNSLGSYLQPPAAGPQPGDVVRNPVGSSYGPTAQPTIAGKGAALTFGRTAAGARQAIDAGGNAVSAGGRPNAVAMSQGAPASGPFGIVGPVPGLEDAAKVSAIASAEQGVGLQKMADGAPVRRAMLANLADDLDKFTSGPGADWQQVGKAWANRNVLPQSMQFDPQSIASQESFNKQSTQLAQQQFAALGGTGTDQQLSSSFKANPNQALSKLGNQQIIQLLRGNEDALEAKARAWQDWQSKNGSGTYGAFQTDFNKTYNPRVYQAMYMSPGQVADMRKNMTQAEQQQFARDYVALKSKGYITPGVSNGQ